MPFRLLLLLALILAMPAADVQAQIPGLLPSGGGGDAAAESLSAEDEAARDAQVAAFLALLRTRGVQQWLEDSAVEEIEGPQSFADMAMEPGGLGHWIAQGRERVARFQGSLAALPNELTTAELILMLELGGAGLARPLMFALLMVGLGALAEAVFRYRLRHLATPDALPVDAAHSTGLMGSQLVKRVGIRLAGLLVFTIVSLGGFFAMNWTQIMELMVFSMLLAIVGTRSISTLARLALSPRRPDLRLMPLNDRTARAVSLWITILAAAAMVGGLGCRALEDLGLLGAGYFALGHLIFTALILLAALAAMALSSHLRTLCGHLAGRLGPAMAPAAVGLALFWLLVVWGLAILGLQPVLAIWLGVSGFFALDQALLPILTRLAQRGMDEGEASPFLPIWRRLLRVGVAVGIAVPVLDTWGIDLFALADSRMGGSALAAASFDIALTLLVADLVWQSARIVIQRRLAKGAAESEAAGESGGEGGGAADPDARAKTLLPLFGKVLGGVLVVLTTMIVLSSLGVDIGPLLAGAGVVGIAIGFGAQALVRDIVSGIFFLIDDAFRVGEYIESGELRGTVEAISLRSMKLRHHRGHIHTVPFGELRSLTNYSRDWVIMKLEFRVPFDTDLGLVKRLIKQVGKELMADPTLGPGFLEPVKSQGVRRMEEFNMVVGVKFMTKPGAQWLIRRDVYQRVLRIFDENGIGLARRDVNVNVRHGATPEEIEDAVAGAAQPVIEQVQEPVPGGAPGS